MNGAGQRVMYVRDETQPDYRSDYQASRSFDYGDFSTINASASRFVVESDGNGEEKSVVVRDTPDDDDYREMRNTDLDSESIGPGRRRVVDDLLGNEDGRRLSCCPCTGCLCSCHTSAEKLAGVVDHNAVLPIDTYVVYFFDYELFSVPRNMESFDVLVEYLRQERIFERSYVVSVSSDTQRDAYAMVVPGGGRSNTESQIERSEYSNNLFRYRPSIVESIDDTRADVRQRFSGLIVQGSRHDWYTVRAALNFPSLIVYVKMAHSRNHVQSNHSIIVDMSQRSFVSTPGTLGLKVARILAHERAKYFNVPHFDFGPLVEQTNLRALQRSAVQQQQHELSNVDRLLE